MLARYPIDTCFLGRRFRSCCKLDEDNYHIVQDTSATNGQLGDRNTVGMMLSLHRLFQALSPPPRTDHSNVESIEMRTRTCYEVSLLYLDQHKRRHHGDLQLCAHFGDSLSLHLGPQAVQCSGIQHISQPSYAALSTGTRSDPTQKRCLSDSEDAKTLHETLGILDVYRVSSVGNTSPRNDLPCVGGKPYSWGRIQYRQLFRWTKTNQQGTIHSQPLSGTQ